MAFRPLRLLVLVARLLALGAGLAAASTAGSAAASEAGASALPDTPTLRAWVEAFKASPRGPFERIRWFCADGTVHPPKPYPCAERGGGVQHGEWNERARAMREGGYAIANVLADVDPARFIGSEADLATLKQILIERFLIDWDDGWIFRGARTYRGALQVEDEEAGALRLVLAMLADPAWREPARFLLLRESVRLLPIPGDEGSASEVRQLALQIAARDESFTPLRAKIHNQPDAGDAARVREYAASRGRKALAGDYERLAAAIDALYTGRGGAQLAVALAAKVELPGLVAAVDRLVPMLDSPRPTMRLAVAARLLGLLRKYFPRIEDPDLALEAMQVSLALEDDAFTAGNTILTQLDALTRRDRLELLDQTAEALYGIGFLTTRHLLGVKESRLRIEDEETPSLNAYREELRYLARVPEWSGRTLVFQFGPSIEHLAPLEPEVQLFPQDRLRGSPLLFYSALIDGLVLDANRLAGIQHQLFGQRVGAGLRALNPGLARGTLRSGEGDRSDPEGIYLLPETTSDLPSVAGILTQGEGSSLSHVQLLARNLGIPNVVVGEEHLPAVRSRLGSRAVLAVSPNGVVQLVADGPRWDAIFGEESERQAQVVIRPDLEKLDLESTDFIPLASLRASDSGRTSGPKGANLGELKHAFGDRVPNGFVIPFGAFRKLLDRPIESGGPSVFAWMKAQYDAIARASGDPVRQQRMVSVFLARLRDWIQNVDPGPGFRERLRSMLEESFGPDGSYGVFVRSDTNVEDLPGFTGAGLNLTVPNVVGFDAILRAIHAVWASPFEDRAYGWRQSHMGDPEYVFPAVVIQLAFPAEKSGVMVTADLENGEPGWITVAVSEGPGGGVEGQSTESLRIDTETGEVRFLAQATEPERPVLLPGGGIAHVPASGAEAVLQPGEIDQLVDFARHVHERFPSLRDENGHPVPADVEFAFRDGRLALLQMRPFVESARAQGSAYLASLDAGLRERGQKPIALDAVPGTEAPEETP